MDDKKLVPKSKNLSSLAEIQDRFCVGETVNQLHYMMREVTKKEISTDTVNAACNCVNALNLTIKTAINAARFLADQKNIDDL